MTQDVTGGRTANRGRRAAAAALALAGGWVLYRTIGRGDRRGRSAGRPATGDATDAEPPRRPMAVEKSVTVGRPADELYDFWRDPDQLTQVVGGTAEVEPAGEDRHRWRVAGPFGRGLEWETEIVEDRPGEVLRWRSTETATVPNEATVRFRPAPADRGTEVTLSLRFRPPGGRIGQTVMGLLGVVPEAMANKMLYRFKSLAETGEIPTLERNPSARGSGDLV